MFAHPLCEHQRLKKKTFFKTSFYSTIQFSKNLWIYNGQKMMLNDWIDMTCSVLIQVQATDTLTIDIVIAQEHNLLLLNYGF